MDKIKQRDNLKKEGRFDDYRIARNEVSSILQEAKRSVHKTKTEEGKDNPKTIWKLFKEFGANNKKYDENSCLKIKLGDDIISDEFDLEKRFNDYFINIAANLKEPIVESNFDDIQEHIGQKIPDNVIFELPEIDEIFVLGSYHSLDVSQATGLDGIGPKMLNLSSGIITKKITYIVNKCILCGHFPDSWKQVKVGPLFKSGAKDDINNYRPISILPTLSKLIEKFMQKHLMNYLNTFDVLHKFQSGFRGGHSTETALTLMTERRLKAINDGNIVGTIMINFRKAFDLVDHDLFIRKLSLYKCGTHFLKLMASYLKSRTQVISVHDKKSYFGEILSGVPQGSILGPLLFLVFINLPLALSQKISATDLYADNTTFYDIRADLETLRSNCKNHF